MSAAVRPLAAMGVRLLRNAPTEIAGMKFLKLRLSLTKVLSRGLARKG